MNTVDPPDPFIRLKEHLESPGVLSGRESDFDMNDDQELILMSAFPEVEAGLRWLEESVTQLWRSADQEALKSQKWHRRLAGVAIGSGTAAIMLAVIQLSLRLTFQRLNDLAAGLELFAAVAALTAVVFGTVAKFNRTWLAQRCRAERLRMLKFRSLARLGWCKNHEAWQEWVRSQLAVENSLDSARLDEWSQAGAGHAEILTWNNESRGFARALAAYYRIKRLNFQANYFNSRREKYQKRIGPWRRYSLRIFFGSVGFVIAHVLAEWAVAPWLSRTGRETGAEIADIVAVVFLTLAAVVPIAGIGVRSWFAAFQLPLSASLYSVKHEELVNAVDHLTDTLSPDVLLNQMERVEHNLGLEHREWLRLLLETEWFL